MIEYAYQIKMPKHVFDYLKNNERLFVHKYSCSHTKARKITRKMVKNGDLTSTPNGDFFILKLRMPNNET